MERLLRNNIVHFAYGLGWGIEKEIEVKISRIYPPKSVTYKGMHYKSYKIDFYTNVSLPNHIGLGKAASTGFGVVYRKRDRKSTRLNSSHVAISYAVFCLKKQNVGDKAAAAL